MFAGHWMMSDLTSSHFISGTVLQNYKPNQWFINKPTKNLLTEHYIELCLYKPYMREKLDRSLLQCLASPDVHCINYTPYNKKVLHTTTHE